MTTEATNQKKIAIIGGGPGGLTLALLLQRKGISSVVYERELVDRSHERGGSLDLHEESGQRALKEAGLYETFKSLARYEGEDFRVVDKSGTIYIDEESDEPVEGGRPEIDRGDLCDLLLQAVDVDTIQYGYKLDKAISLEDGKTEIHFENGFVDQVDLLIGADGAFSRVRPLLTEVDVEYSGLTMIELNIPDAVAKHPELAAFNKRGKMFGLDDHKGIIGQFNGDGRIKVYVSLHVERNWLETSGIPFDQPVEAKKRLLEMFHDWNDQLKNYISYSEDSIVTRRIYMLPIGFNWKHNQGVTLIGDAAHVMSPFAGEGVNMAMFDALELASAISRNQNDYSKAIQEYETIMFAESKEKAEQSDATLRLCFSEHAAPRLAELMNSFNV